MPNMIIYIEPELDKKIYTLSQKQGISKADWIINTIKKVAKTT